MEAATDFLGFDSCLGELAEGLRPGDLLVVKERKVVLALDGLYQAAAPPAPEPLMWNLEYPRHLRLGVEMAYRIEQCVQAMTPEVFLFGKDSDVDASSLQAFGLPNQQGRSAIVGQGLALLSH